MLAYTVRRVLFLRELDRRATHRRVEIPRDRQVGHPARPRPLGVDARTANGSDYRHRAPRSSELRSTGKLVGRRVEDLAMQPLKRPSVLYEIDGQPIEQFRMGRGFTQKTKVA